MRVAKPIYITFLATLCLFMTSCENLIEVNKNPNAPENVSSNFLLTYVLTNTGKTVFSLGNDGSKIGAAMQYWQSGTNEGAAEINQYAWTQQGWNVYYDYLRNNQLIYENGVRDNNRFFQAIALTMKSYLFGLVTDLYGDVPYSEALKANSEVYFPKYDSQADIYKGILTDLKEASALLSSLEAKDAISASADVMYKGDAAKWKKLANSLRLRYALRLANKRTEMAAVGVNLETEFKEASAAAFASNSDNASITFIGTTKENAAPGGLLNSANPNWKLKPSQVLVSKLLKLNDPRLQRWVNPVQRKWDANVTTTTTKTVTNMFGESYSVVYVPADASSADTSLYVGLPISLSVTDIARYNKGNDAATYPNERNPYISFIHDRYRKNEDPLVTMDLMTYAEVEFILSEAALLGGFGATDPEDHYKKGIRSSMTKANVFAAASFNFDTYYAQPSVAYTAATDKQERILEQKWISGWFGIQSWFDWRRTGFPALKTGPVAQYGAALPLRYIYPTANLDPKYIVNYNAAIDKLGTTNYIPSGQSKDHHYAKMWLLQGTGKPY
jgi:hypothetical protein